MQIRLLDAGWDRAIAAAADEGHEELRIICPFIKHRAAKRLLTTGHHPKIQVITRFNLADFCAGVSDIEALQWLLDQGAEIRGIKSLHAKMYLFGANHTLVTSANLTEAALLRNHEFGFVSQDAAISRRCHEYFDQLWKLAGPNLTFRRVAEWETRLRNVVIGGLPPARETGLSDEGADVAMGLGEHTSESPIPITLSPPASENDQGFVKFLGLSNDRVPIATPVLEVIRKSGCHWACAYPLGKRPRIVRDGALMFLARLVDEASDIAIFGRAIAIRHVSTRDDATPADIAEHDWKPKWPHYVRVHHGEFVAGTLKHGIRLSDLIRSLGANGFASTKQRLAGGEADVNPRRAYGQQAAVRLSDEGISWLNSRLELAFRNCGKIPPEDLNMLYWPNVQIETAVREADTAELLDFERYKEWSVKIEGRKLNTAEQYVYFIQRCIAHYREAINARTVPNETAANEIIGRIEKVVRRRGRWTDGAFNEPDVTQNLTPALRAYGRFVESTKRGDNPPPA
jgi:hypothetical protein